MKRRPADKPRLWPLRLVQLAPVVALGLLVAAWFAVPTSMRDTALWATSAEHSADDASTADRESAILQKLRPSEGIPGTQWNPAGHEFKAVCTTTTAAVMRTAWRLHDASGTLTPFPLPKDDPAFSALAEYEKRTGARVFAFAIPARPDPPIALSAVTSLGALTAAERKEYEASGTIRRMRDTLAWRSLEGRASVLPIDLSSGGAGGGRDDDDSRGFYSGSVTAGGHVYEVYWLFMVEADSSDGASFPWLSNTTALDTPENRQTIQRAASAGRGAVFVVGPTDAVPIPLLAPNGAASATSAALKAADGYLPGTYQTNPVRRLNPELAEQLGGGAWVTTHLADPPGLIARSPDGRSVAKDPVLYVAVWDANPDIPIMWEVVGRTPVREFQVWLAARLPFVLGVLGVLLAASLIASPLAFVRERHLTAELEIEREQERIRRAARKSVIERLTDLSHRIDRAAGGVTGDNRSDVSQTARDIDSTIIDLRRILGELDVRGDDHE